MERDRADLLVNVRDCREVEYELFNEEREQPFLADMEEELAGGGLPSDRQRDWLLALHDRACRSRY